MAEPTKRQRRVAEQIHEVMSDALTFGVSDPLLSGLTVTDVAIDRELKYATVYVTSMHEGDSRKRETLKALEKASGFLRREVALMIDLPTVPELRFKWDDTYEAAQRIEGILDSLDIPEESDDDE